jgi:hypothetical protein
LRYYNNNMSGNGRGSPYDEPELLKKTVPELKTLCSQFEIDVRGTTTKQTIIDRILGRTKPPESASAKAASAKAPSPGGKGASITFTNTMTARKSPEQKHVSAKGGDDPEFQLKAERERRKHEWGVKTAKEGQPWTNIATLKHIFDTKMMPKSREASKEPTVVILVGPAAAGKSSALERVGLGLTDHNTVRVDPDKIYEWLAGKYGYVPPEIKEIEKDPTQYKDESDAKYRERCDKNRARLTKQYADRLAWWLANKDTFDELYDREFEDVGERDFKAAEFCTPKTSGVLGQYGVVLPSMEKMIFEGATKAGGRLNVLLDTTGGMKGTFLEEMAEKFIEAKYTVVVVLVVSSKADCIARVSGPGGRNAQQHRKLDDCIVGQIWRNFVTEKTSCRWEHFSREQRTEFAVVQNTWTPSNASGSARVVYRRNSDGRTESVVPADELSHILRTYNVTTDSKTGGFLCAAGSASASKGRGGSSRKRRISRRRIHGSRARKTIKKYTRPLSRRRRHHHHHHI